MGRKRKTTAEFIEQAEAIHDNAFDYSKTKYVVSTKKVAVRCRKCFTSFYVLPSSHLQGTGCRGCWVNTRKRTTDGFIRDARKVHADIYEYLSEYVSPHTCMTIKCLACGKVFSQTPTSHQSGRGCPACSSLRATNKRRKTTEEFIERARETHGDRYSYSLAVYLTNATKLVVVCKTHGPFTQTPVRHWRGQGCPTCGQNVITAKQSFSNSDFIRHARSTHGHRYDYSLAEYAHSNENVVILCSTHGKFLQRPAIHVRGAGCAKCAGTARLTTAEFIKKAKKVHGSSYGYSEVSYVAHNIKIRITCSKHGVFLQTPCSHAAGNGCPHCARSSISKVETEWLDSLNIPERQYKITLSSGRTTKVDGYDPKTNTVYAFLGSFWHADPRQCPPDEIHPVIGKKNEHIYLETLERLTELKNLGFGVVSIWEHDYAP